MNHFETARFQTKTIVNGSNISPATLRRRLVEDDVNISGHADVLLDQLKIEQALFQPDFRLAFVRKSDFELPANCTNDDFCEYCKSVWGLSVASEAHLLQIISRIKEMISCQLAMKPIIHPTMGTKMSFIIHANAGLWWLDTTRTVIKSPSDFMWAFVVPED